MRTRKKIMFSNCMLGMFLDEERERCVIGSPIMFRASVEKIASLYFGRNRNNAVVKTYRPHFRIEFPCSVMRFRQACLEMEEDLITVEDTKTLGRLMR